MASARDANRTPKSAPEVVALASRLYKQGVSYRANGAELAKAGPVNERGRSSTVGSRSRSLVIESADGMIPTQSPERSGEILSMTVSRI